MFACSMLAATLALRPPTALLPGGEVLMGGDVLAGEGMAGEGVAGEVIVAMQELQLASAPSGTLTDFVSPSMRTSYV